METKREMILRAFKWREDMKRKSDEELFAKTLLVFMFIITLSQLCYIYNNFDKKLEIKYLDKKLEVNCGNEECSNGE